MATFEQIFQERLNKLLGPEPGATYRRVFSGSFDNVTTPYDEFVQSQFQEMHDRYLTIARTRAERGQDIPTFERFLLYAGPTLRTRYSVSREGAMESLNNFLNQAERGGKNRQLREDPFTQFVGRNFDRLYNEFVLNADRKKGVKDFNTYLMQQGKRLRQEFEFTEEGASESLRQFEDISKFKGHGVVGDPRFDFIKNNFGRLYEEFRDTGKAKGGPKTFQEFIFQRAPRTEQEFSLERPFERGQRAPGELAGLSRIR